MTNEQAKSELMQIYMSLSEEKKQALDMAIQALSQEPCEDAISRDAVLEKAVYTETEEGWCGYTVDVDYIKSLPSVKPQGPCEDAISRQAVHASIKNLYPDMPIADIFGARRKWLEKYAPYFECENAVEQLPSVKPQPKTGWHIAHGMYEDRFWCSCGYIRIMDSGMNEWKFCPVCGGVRMVEEQEGE